MTSSSGLVMVAVLEEEQTGEETEDASDISVMNLCHFPFLSSMYLSHSLLPRLPFSSSYPSPPFILFMLFLSSFPPSLPPSLPLSSFSLSFLFLSHPPYPHVVYLFFLLIFACFQHLIFLSLSFSRLILTVKLQASMTGGPSTTALLMISNKNKRIM